MIYQIFGILVVIQGCSSLLCHTCISFECAKELDQKDCDFLQNIAEDYVGEYREIQGHLPTCPKANDTRSWAIMKSDSGFIKRGTCSRGSHSCGVTGFTILSKSKEIKPRIQGYGVVLGCTVERKFRADFCDAFSRCNPGCKAISIVHRTRKDIAYSVNVQACTGNNTGCSNCDRCGGNYCVSEEASVPTPPTSDSGAYWILNVGIVGGAIVAALLAFLCCLYPKPVVFHGTLEFDETEMKLQRKV